MIENILLLCVCAFTMIRSAAYLFNTGKILKKGVLTEGRIIDFKRITFGILEIKQPIIEFTTLSGKRINCVFTNFWFRRKEERKVTVVYDPSQPNRFFIDNSVSELFCFVLLSLSVSALLLTLYRIATSI